MMNLKEALQQCPKAAEKYYAWAGQALRELQKQFADQVPADMESHLPDIDEGIMRSYGDITLESNFRNLYDFFDSNGIYVSIYRDMDYRNEYWDLRVWESVDNQHVNDGIKIRIVAEIEGFTQAFKLLEEKLNKQ